MQKNRINTWMFWTILVFGLLIVGACSDGSPTSPDPSDVQDFTFEGGGGIGGDDLSGLVDEYDALQGLGGGVMTLAEDPGYTLIGAFDRTTGFALTDTRLVLEQPGEEPISILFNDKALFSNLTYPITVSVYSPHHVMQTVVGTNAHVIAFGMELLPEYDMPCFIFGYSFTYNYIAEPWYVQATSTHPDFSWVPSFGEEASPNTMVLANPGQPVGAIAFLYEGEDGIIWSPFDLENPDNYQMVGYSYAHIGTLDPGVAGGWILNLNETGEGNSYTAGNYIVDYSWPITSDNVPLVHGTLTITPGGLINASREFVPYYAPLEIPLSEETGTYEIKAFSPPTTVDRHVIRAEITYWDGGRDLQYVDWDPAGAGVPDLAFTDLPACSEAVLETSPYPALEVTWVNDAAVGMQIVTVTDNDGVTQWEIFVDDDATNLTANGVIIPNYNPDIGTGELQLLPFGTGFASVTRIESPGITMNDFDQLEVWSDATTYISSVAERALADPVVP